ncbi:MAG: BamA/TamA family outer membrane protein [Candidatus Eisenbacteria bacterium]|uniref:BamA/TamA family outer membrane protein n=1 Tax=Eiseniibacteriota bacterium TaxID=2212470 RepID=A0A849SMD1_UNCEI|nr:BamA/TamA family outer membrane protein [Candidatus Eisenbacteria bacterium]
MRSAVGAAGLCILAGVALALTPRPVAAQLFGQNKVQYERYEWRTWSSDHFDVYAYAGFDSLALRVLDLAEKTSPMLEDALGHRLRRRIPIILYGSHNDFAQTNVTPELIEGSTGGFTEVFRNRVVLPYTGSYEDLRHVLVHELVHAHMFDLLYGGSASSLIAGGGFFSVPLWFAEGMAEYFSLGGEDPNMEMFLRDGTLEDYLPPLPYSGGYFVYKQGQLAITYLVERYGVERFRDVLQKLRTTRNFELAFQRSTGTTVVKFDEQYREWLRKRYWPQIAVKEDPDKFARRLTRHGPDESNFNTAPSISPQGDRVVFFSDRRQYADVFVMSAFDGKGLRRLIRGERDVRFESVPSFRGALSWSPDGRRVAITAKSRGRDVLYVIDAENGKVLKDFEFPCEALTYPAWSPVSDSIVVSGLQNGRSDLWMVDTGTGVRERLTDDTWDERDATWRPDGRGLTFSSDRLAPVVMHPRRYEKGYGRFGIFTLDLGTREVVLTLDTGGEDRSPAWSPDGRKLAFVSDHGGTPNAFLFDPADSTLMRLTDVRGGIQSLTWSRQNDRIVFAAFTKGGFDVFAVKAPLSQDAVVQRLRREQPESVMSFEDMRRHWVDSVSVQSRVHGSLEGDWPDSLTLAVDTLDLSRGGLAARDSLARPRGPSGPPPWADAGLRTYPAPLDTLAPLPKTYGLVERGGPFEIPDSLIAQVPSPYRAQFAAEGAGGSVYASNLGFLGATQLSLADFLGDRRIEFALGLYSNSLSDANALIAYHHLPGRWDWSVGAFHFKEYFESDVSTLGEQFGSDRIFSERNFGALVSGTYPFDKFRRFELGYVQRFVERQFFVDDGFGFLIADDKEFRSVSGPTVSLVGDNTLFGYYGPVNGSRYNATISAGLPWTGHALAYRTYSLDARQYYDLTHGYTFARRLLVGWSEGRNPQSFRVGGFSTLRGFDDYSISGNRLALTSLELRFPFIRQLGLVGPLPLGVFNLRGATFVDAGMVWNDGYSPRVSNARDPGGRKFQDLRFDYGVGVRSWVWFLLAKVDVGWQYDLRKSSEPHWQFSIGPEF